MNHYQNKNSVDAASSGAPLPVCRAVNIRQNENGDTLSSCLSSDSVPLYFI